MAKIYSLIASCGVNTIAGAGTNYPVKTNAGVYYEIYIDNTTGDVYFRKSTDGGKTWSNGTVVAAITATQVAVWYDRWSGVNGDLIHLAYTDSGVDDTFYRSIDTANSDALSTQTVIFAGTSTAGGGAISITRARGGNLYCKVMIDAGAEGGFFRSTDVGANWTARTDSEALATTDQWIGVPGWGADNQDVSFFFWDASADEISIQRYDDSGDSWAETSIATGMVDVAATAAYPNFAATVDITNSQNLLIAWNGVDTANQDLPAWKITESAITPLADVVTNGTDDQGLCAITIDTDTQDLYAFYAGKSDGSDIWTSALNIYYKVSTDDGGSWGAETKLTPDTGTFSLAALWATPRFDTRSAVVFAISMAANSALVAAIDEPAAAAAGGAHILGGTVVR